MSRRTSRGLTLTDKGRAAIGVAGPVSVPLLTDDGLRAIFQLPCRARGVSSQIRFRARQGSLCALDSVESHPCSTLASCDEAPIGGESAW